MRSSFFVGVALFVGASALACGGARGPAQIPSDIVPGDPAPAPAPVPGVLPSTPDPAPAASRCPEGVHEVGLWQGEYPGPVVHVKSAVTLQGRADPCDGAATSTCTFEPAIYHPWSASDPGATYATLRPILRFVAQRAWSGTADDGKPVAIAAGGEATVLAYFGEGYCQWGAGGATFTAECPEMLSDAEGTVFDALPSPEFAEVQVLGAPCREGHTAYVDVDAALFARPEIEEGVIVGYGEVGPAR